MRGQTLLKYLLACMLLILASGSAIAQVPPPSHWQSAIDQFVAGDAVDPPPQQGVLFVGSSSIRMWDTLATDFPGVPVINRGFGGSAIADSTHYADRIIIPYHPKVIVMYAGDNDIAGGLTPAQVSAEFQSFATRVRSALPDTAIVYISIKPSILRKSMWPQMHQANQAIERWMSTRKRMTFVNVAAKMLDAKGKPRPSLFRKDGLHMAPAGYVVWTRALKPVLAQYGFKTH